METTSLRMKECNARLLGSCVESLNCAPLLVLDALRYVCIEVLVNIRSSSGPFFHFLAESVYGRTIDDLLHPLMSFVSAKSFAERGPRLTVACHPKRVSHSPAVLPPAGESLVLQSPPATSMDSKSWLPSYVFENGHLFRSLTGTRWYSGAKLTKSTDLPLPRPPVPAAGAAPLLVPPTSLRLGKAKFAPLWPEA
jgi:hypothetical protein